MNLNQRILVKRYRLLQRYTRKIFNRIVLMLLFVNSNNRPSLQRVAHFKTAHQPESTGVIVGTLTELVKNNNKFLDIANKQAESLKMLAESSAARSEGTKMMAEAIKT
ncbi:large ribosomal subunit protein eL18-like [Musca vetustissima]|uniref:large ribosomal subunit protein eL18-like n=1 Tax=Musca vetustissima TaxID=27455 RepID=UPI002AB6A70E|nr:large ribosomal subunit protein eL18-like [Musca vetustissima]